MCLSYEDLVPVSRSSTEVFKTGLWGKKRPLYREGIGPCRQACPCGIDIPSVLSFVSKGDFDRALGQILLENPFPGICGRVCYHPCELSCNRGRLDETVSVRSIERAVSDYGKASPVRLSRTKPKSVAIVGGGPAGLSCAYFLLSMGHKVSIYEKDQAIGGVLRYGIPAYRLPESVLEREIERLLSMGPDVHTGVKVDGSLLNELLLAHDSVFLALGLEEPRRLDIEGEKRDGVYYGLPYLRGERPIVGRCKHAVVIGGGDVAMDAARKLLREQPTAKVSIYAPEQFDSLPALKENLEEAMEEGIEIRGGLIPVSFEGDGRVQKVRFVDVKVETDPVAGQRRFVRGKEAMDVEADVVVICAGQVPRTDFLPSQILDERGLVRCDRYGRTRMARLFAGGDIVGFKATVADAIASGKRAAMAIDMDSHSGEPPDIPLLGNSLLPSFSHYLGIDRKETGKVLAFEALNTIPVPFSAAFRPEKERPGQRRKDFREVSKGFREKEAMEEAGRCLSCGLCKGCDLCFLVCPDVAIVRKDLKVFSVKDDYCKACGVCARVCPCGVLEMVDRE